MPDYIIRNRRTDKEIVKLSSQIEGGLQGFSVAVKHGSIKFYEERFKRILSLLKVLTKYEKLPEDLESAAARIVMLNDYRSMRALLKRKIWRYNKEAKKKCIAKPAGIV